MESKRKHLPNTLSPDRLKAFSDGVFAIVLTLPVLDLETPEGPHASLGAYLLALEPQLRPYIATFITVATFWVTQSVILHYIKTCNRLFIWLNVLLFLPVSLSPFITAQRSSHVGEPVMARLAGSVQVLSFLILLLIWHYAVYRLRDHPPAPKIVRSLDRRIFGAIGFCIAAAIVAPLSERVATLLFFCVPMLFVSHTALDEGIALDANQQE